MSMHSKFEPYLTSDDRCAVCHALGIKTPKLTKPGTINQHFKCCININKKQYGKSVDQIVVELNKYQIGADQRSRLRIEREKVRKKKDMGPDSWTYAVLKSKSKEIGLRTTGKKAFLLSEFKKQLKKNSKKIPENSTFGKLAKNGGLNDNQGLTQALDTAQQQTEAVNSDMSKNAMDIDGAKDSEQPQDDDDAVNGSTTTTTSSVKEQRVSASNNNQNHKPETIKSVTQAMDRMNMNGGNKSRRHQQRGRKKSKRRETEKDWDNKRRGRRKTPHSSRSSRSRSQKSVSPRSRSRKTYRNVTILRSSKHNKIDQIVINTGGSNNNNMRLNLGGSSGSESGDIAEDQTHRDRHNNQGHGRGYRKSGGGARGRRYKGHRSNDKDKGRRRRVYEESDSDRSDESDSNLSDSDNDSDLSDDDYGDSRNRKGGRNGRKRSPKPTTTTTTVSTLASNKKKGVLEFDCIGSNEERSDSFSDIDQMGLNDKQ